MICIPMEIAVSFFIFLVLGIIFNVGSMVLTPKSKNTRQDVDYSESVYVEPTNYKDKDVLQRRVEILAKEKQKS